MDNKRRVTRSTKKSLDPVTRNLLYLNWGLFALMAIVVSFFTGSSMVISLLIVFGAMAVFSFVPIAPAGWVVPRLAYLIIKIYLTLNKRLRKHVYENIDLMRLKDTVPQSTPSEIKVILRAIIIVTAIIVFYSPNVIVNVLAPQPTENNQPYSLGFLLAVFVLYPLVQLFFYIVDVLDSSGIRVRHNDEQTVYNISDFPNKISWTGDSVSILVLLYDVYNQLSIFSNADNLFHFIAILAVFPFLLMFGLIMRFFYTRIHGERVMHSFITLIVTNLGSQYKALIVDTSDNKKKKN